MTTRNLKQLRPPSVHALRLWCCAAVFLVWASLASSLAVTVRVATFNIKNGIPNPGTTAYEATKAILVRMDADVIGFQELLRNSTTAAWEDHWRQLAAELGYTAEFGPDGTTMSGSQRLGYFSRYPIIDVAHIRSPSPASEMTRLPMRIAVEVPGASKPLVLWNMHHKANEGSDPTTLARNQFRRAVEAIRIAQDIDAYRAVHPDHDEFIVLGDLNADVFGEAQQEVFTQLPSGLPASYRLGEDIVFPIYYRYFPDDAYGAAGGGMYSLDAFQQNSDIRYTYPSWPSVLDYVILSAALYEAAPAPPVGEVYNSIRDAQFPDSGLPKAGSALSASTSSTASDHLPVFVDIEMSDAGPPDFFVGPSEPFSIAGEPGGVFSPSIHTYTISNSALDALSWNATVSVPWLQLSETNGMVPAEAAGEVIVSFHQAQAPTAPGTYFGTVRFQNPDTGSHVTRQVVLTVLQTARLAVSPPSGIYAGGPPGGPFTLSFTNFIVSNSGQTPLHWIAATGFDWLDLSVTAGELAPGTGANVTVSLNESATNLPEGIYTASITFLNLVNGDGDAVRTMSLDIGNRDYFTQNFAGDFNLAGQSITFARSDSLDYYLACSEPTSLFPVDPAGGTVLTLSDDSFAAVDLADNASINLYGTNYSRVFVGSNGYLTFGSGDTSYSRSMVNHFRLPRISALYTDLNPARGGIISWRQWPDRLAVTFEEVPEFSAGGTNNFQVELFFDGRIRMTYLQVDAKSAIVGLSRGAGLPGYFVGSVFTNYASCLLEPLGMPMAGSISTNFAYVVGSVLALDRYAFSAHGFVVSRAEDQLAPTLETSLTQIIAFTGAPPGLIETLVTGLDSETDYAVRSYLVQNGDVFYSPPGWFRTLAIELPPGPVVYFADFEGVSKTSYASASLMINGRLWNLDDALIGTVEGDMKNGARSVRMRNGSITMLEDLPGGIGQVSFLYARSNFSNDRTGTSPSFVMEYSVNQGATWQQAGDTTSLAGVDNLMLFQAMVQVSQPARIRIRKVAGTDGKRWNIDDLTIFAYSGTTEPMQITSPLFAAVRVGEDFNYQITANRPPEYYEAEGLPPGLSLDDQTGLIEGAPVAAGYYELIIAAGNNGDGDSATLALTVDMGESVILVSPIASTIYFGQPLSQSLLGGGSANVPGTFAFAQPETIPSVGQADHEVLFTPVDTNNYESASLMVNVTVEAVMEETTFAIWSQGADRTPDLLQQYAIGGAANMDDFGEPPEYAFDPPYLVITAVIRVNDPNLSVVGLAAIEVTRFDNGQEKITVPGLAAADQEGVPAGCRRQEFRIAHNETERLFLGLSITLQMP